MADGSSRQVALPFAAWNVVDLFAGGGGASTGIEWAGGHVAVAVNHDPDAVAMHAANHPTTAHYCKSVYDVAPFRPGGRPIDLLWASPDCTHHSRAKGGKPVESGRRDLAWVIIDWAREVRPRIIALENVPEFRDWGPLHPEDHPDEDCRNRPIKERAGETFAEFTGALEALGYVVEHRTLRACDYGAPTTRDRLYLVARCDGRPVRWPAPTHGPGRSRPHRTAAECIDWSIPMRSIFDRPKPLAEATQRRIAEGMRRFVFEDPNPFILDTIAAGGDNALCIPSLIQTGYGERAGQAPRVLDLGKPLGTVVAGGSKHAIVGAWLAKHYGGVTGHGLNRPLGTVTTVDHHAVCGAVFAPDPPDVEERARKAAAFIVKYRARPLRH